MPRYILLVTLLTSSGFSFAVNYAEKESWLCRPDYMNACDTNLDTTIIAADGTLTALRARFSGKPMEADRALAFNDVVDAWHYYLEHDNQGRGVVRIGHSQGSGVLTGLIANQIDGKPIQSQILSAILIGTSGVVVPEGKNIGGTFKHMPVCREESETQCIITYASFRTEIPPPEDSLFGRPRSPGGISACVNPANLAGGPGELHAYFGATGTTIASGQIPMEWVTPPVKINTPFVSLPGLLNGQCI